MKSQVLRYFSPDQSKGLTDRLTLTSPEPYIRETVLSFRFLTQEQRRKRTRVCGRKERNRGGDGEGNGGQKKKEKARKRRIRERDVFLNQEIFPLDT